MEKFELPIENKISEKNNESQKAKSENEDLQSENNTDLSDITSEKYKENVVQKEDPVGQNEFECGNDLEMSMTDKTETSTMLIRNPHSVFRACIFRSNVYCDLCQLKINFDDLNQHFNGKRHVRSLKIGIPKFSCELCNFEIEDQNKLLKHISGEEHKKKIDQQNVNDDKDTAFKPEPEQEKKEYNFKFLSGVKGVTVLNLGNPEDLAKVIVPTKSMKIEPSNIPLRMTRDIQSLVVKTTPIRIYGLDPPLEAEMCQEKNVDQTKSIEDPEMKNSHDLDQPKSKTLNSTERSKISLPDNTRTTSHKIDSKRSTPFSLKPSASYAGSTNIPKETTPKKLSPLPPIDPAVELICKNWRYLMFNLIMINLK